jgi:hypothetical protein
MLRAMVLAALVTVSMMLGSAAATADAGFSVQKDEHGVWWIVDPAGRRFYSVGVNNITPEPYNPKAGTRYYNPVPGEFGGDLGRWASSVRRLLTDHGFNTYGAWSSSILPTADSAEPRMYQTPVLYVVAHAPERCLQSLLPDYESFIRANTRESLAKITDRSGLLGVFLDNEMAWFGKSGWDDIATYTLLERGVDLPFENPLRAATIEFLKGRYESAAKFAAAWGITLDSWDQLGARPMQSAATAAARQDRIDFTTLLADRFFDTATRVVREELPGVLILGTRFPGSAPEPVIRACGRTCDVVSVNHYFFGKSVDAQSLARFWHLGGRPLMHTEFSWRARENNSGNPNNRGAGAVLDTQAQRAEHYQALVEDIATLPFVIGSHWFEFADQSPEGRFDGENSNYGIVDIHNKPYTELLTAMKRTHARIETLHRETRRAIPELGSAADKVTYAPGQHPARPPRMDLLTDWIREPEIWGAPDAQIRWSREGTDLILDYDTGSQYGGGINIFGPKGQALTEAPAGATDLDGYAAFIIDATAPRDLQLNVVLAEAGAAEPHARLDLRAGDDGEAFISAPLFGTGERARYRIPIDSLTRQAFFGSRTGALRIDMQAIRNVGLQVQGQPTRGRVVVHGLALER